MYFHQLDDPETMLLLKQIRYERQQRQVPCPLDGGRNTALVLQRVTGDATGQNFTLIVDKLEQKVRVFVVDVLDAVFAEAAVFLAFLTQVRIA